MQRILPLERNDNIEITIDALGSEGQGVGRYEGYAVFVPGALPGERVRAHIIKAASSYAVGKLLEVISPAPERTRPRCPAFPQCGGCTLQHGAYSLQLQAKQQQVASALERLGGFREYQMLPILGMENPWEYRNKAAFPFAEENGRVEMGFFAPRSHRLIPLESCPIQRRGIPEAALAVRDWANEFGVSAYDEQTGKGLLRHVVVRACQDGQLMAVVVSTGPLPAREQLAARLKERAPGLKSLLWNRNPARTNVILGREYQKLWGEDKIEETILGNRFAISAASFLQVNPVQTQKLYETALDFAGLTGTERAVDLYCGIGTITLALGRGAKTVLGVESVAAAIQDAKENARVNGVQNAQFTCGLAEEVLPRLVGEGLRPDVIVLDPPRKGAETAALCAIAAAGTPRVVYVSCNPATLARDARILADQGYRLIKAQPVDMFPQTAHVECVVLLSKVQN